MRRTRCERAHANAAHRETVQSFRDATKRDAAQRIDHKGRPGSFSSGTFKPHGGTRRRATDQDTDKQHNPPRAYQPTSLEMQKQQHPEVKPNATVGKDAQRPCGHRSRPLTYARASGAAGEELTGQSRNFTVHRHSRRPAPSPVKFTVKFLLGLPARFFLEPSSQLEPQNRCGEGRSSLGRLCKATTRAIRAGADDALGSDTPAVLQPGPPRAKLPETHRSALWVEGGSWCGRAGV